MSTEAASSAAMITLQQETLNLLLVGNHYFITRAMWIVSLTVIIYDYCQTFRDEVRFVWNGSRASPSRMLFLLNRYWPIANILVDNIILATVSSENSRFCRVWMNYVGYSALPIHASIGVIQILRIHAMYNRDRKLLALMCTLFALDLVVGTVTIGLVVHEFDPVSLPPGFNGCIPSHIPSYAWIYWLPMLIMEILLFILSALKSVESMQDSMKMPFIMSMLFRDSVIYFAGVMASVVVNFVVWRVARQQLFAAFLPIAFAMHSIIGCRMLMNIQKAIRPYSVSTTSQRPLISGSSGTRPTSPGPESSAGPSDYYLKPVQPQALGHVGFPPDLKDPRAVSTSESDVRTFSASTTAFSEV